VFHNIPLQKATPSSCTTATISKVTTTASVTTSTTNTNPNPNPTAATASATSSTQREFKVFGEPGYCMELELASDVVMRTAAAPTYFPSWQQYVDGYVADNDRGSSILSGWRSHVRDRVTDCTCCVRSGMFAHDPASEALKLAISPFKLKLPPSDIIMLSFGTGKVNHAFEDSEYDWGYVQWVPKLPALLWDGMIKKSESFCEELLGERYAIRHACCVLSARRCVTNKRDTTL
jgi:hypothetical protein